MSEFYDTGGGIFGGPGFLNRGRGLQFFQPSINSNRVKTPYLIIGDTITLASNTPGAVIYYTIDGSPPSIESTIYSMPIALPDATTTYKAIAVKVDLDDSAIMTRIYEILKGYDYDGNWDETYTENFGERYEESWT